MRARSSRPVLVVGLSRRADLRYRGPGHRENCTPGGVAMSLARIVDSYRHGHRTGHGVARSGSSTARIRTFVAVFVERLVRRSVEQASTTGRGYPDWCTTIVSRERSVRGRSLCVCIMTGCRSWAECGDGLGPSSAPTPAVLTRPAPQPYWKTATMTPKDARESIGPWALRLVRRRGVAVIGGRKRGCRRWHGPGVWRVRRVCLRFWCCRR